MKIVRRAGVPSVFGLLLRCSGDTTPSPADAALDVGDAAADSAVEATPGCARTFTFEQGSATGHADPLHAPRGQVRAGRLAATDLPADPTGLATWAPGDYVLANDHVAMVIEAARRSDLYDPWGGKPVGVAHVRDGHLVEAGDFNESTYAVGRHTLQTRSVTVLHDGSDGGPAVIRATGMLTPIPFLDEFARALAARDYTDLEAAFDYELSPNSDAVAVYITFNVTRDQDVQVPTSVHAFFQRYRMPMFIPGVGFSSPPREGTIPWVGFVDDRGTSYAWRAADGPMQTLVSESGFDGLISPAYRVPACAQTRRKVADIIVGGTGLDGLLATMAAVDNTPQRTLRGQVLGADMRGAPGVRVHALMVAGDRYITRATTDAQGNFELRVPMDADVNLRAFRTGDTIVGPVHVAPGATTAMLTMGPSGMVHVTVTEAGSNLALPVRVQVIPMTGNAPSAPGNWGESQPGEGRYYIEYPTTGETTLRLPVGAQRVLVSRGFEYELSTTDVQVTDGATTEVRVSLARSVPTPGVLCGDFHIHTHRSPDAEDSVLLKISAIAGDGVEIGVRSDHEYVADFAPIIRELGINRWVMGVGSIEFTTFTWGHFGVVPLTPDPTKRNGGSFDWANMTPPEVFAAVRASPDAPTIIINHPRGGTNYFDMARYNRTTGEADPVMWDNAFTAVEFFNESDFETNRNGLVADWYSFLQRGRRVFAVGSSDSHKMNPTQAVGYPRTCLALGTDDPQTVTPVQIRDAVARGRSFVTGGIYLTVTGPNGIGPGQETTGVGASTRIQVMARAASWLSADRLELIVDGVSVQTLPLMAAGALDAADPTLRFRGELTVPVAERGSWVIVAAHGDRAMDQVYFRKRPFGVSNPMFLSR